MPDASSDHENVTGATFSWSVSFLPDYSPDLNPVEMLSSEVQNALRSAEARTESAPTETITSALAMVTRHDAINRFAHFGYSITETDQVEP